MNKQNGELNNFFFTNNKEDFNNFLLGLLTKLFFVDNIFIGEPTFK